MRTPALTRLKDIPTDVPAGKPGYEAPGNIGIMIIGWLYGEDDFGKSLCIACNCGEDTDCTCATLGAILGIIHGRKGIPGKWVEPIGDVIKSPFAVDYKFPVFNVLLDYVIEPYIRLNET